MLETLITLLFFALATVIMVQAARCDWKGMQIPNRYSLGLLGLFIIGVMLPSSLFNGIHLISSLVAAGIVALMMVVLYAMNAMGGGDTKLATTAALLVGMSDLGLFMIVMTCTGGLLAVYALMIRKHPNWLPQSVEPEGVCWLSRLKQGVNKVPYGLAIASGTLGALGAKWILPLL